MSNEPTFGEMLRQLRLLTRLTQEELAERAGLAAITIRRLESGQTTPYPKTLAQLLQALALSPEVSSGMTEALVSALHRESVNTSEDTATISEPSLGEVSAASLHQSILALPAPMPPLFVLTL